jgi:hypothetical protein
MPYIFPVLVNRVNNISEQGAFQKTRAELVLFAFSRKAKGFGLSARSVQRLALVFSETCVSWQTRNYTQLNQ